MSRLLEDRVLAAHPLAPAHRMVLLWVARQVPEGHTEVLLNRAALGRELEASPAVVSRALQAGEDAGVCRLSKGRVAFEAHAGSLVNEPAPARPLTAVREAPPRTDGERPAPARLKPQTALAVFARHWTGRYRKTYRFTPSRDHRWAREVLCGLSEAELSDVAAYYLAADDAFYDECAHAFSVFCRDINKLQVRAAGRRTAAPRPAVRDADATREYLRRQRGEVGA